MTLQSFFEPGPAFLQSILPGNRTPA